MFQSILANLMARVEGSQWAMVVGVDGVLVETSPLPESANGETLAAEYATLFRACHKVTTETAGEGLQSSVFFTDRGKLIFQFLTLEYFLLMGLAQEGHPGKARYEIARARGLLERELVF